MSPFIKASHLSLRYPVFKKVAKRNSEAADAVKELEQAGARMDGKGKIRDIQALRDVSFELKAGDRLGIIGRNGSGKSTLLRVLGGIYEPTGGSIQVQGSVAPLFSVGLGTRQEATGRENIILRGIMKGLTRKQAKELIPEIEDFTGLGEFLDMPVRTYSAGMAMRLSFAIATSMSPDILLLDEWLGAGDADFRAKASKRMTSFVGQAGITVIASHNRKLMEDVCTLGLWLDRGEMRAFGPISEVFDKMEAQKPANQKKKPGQKAAQKKSGKPAEAQPDWDI